MLTRRAIMILERLAEDHAARLGVWWGVVFGDVYTLATDEFYITVAIEQILVHYNMVRYGMVWYDQGSESSRRLYITSLLTRNRFVIKSTSVPKKETPKPVNLAP